MLNVLCKLGVHDYEFTAKFYPHIQALVLEQAEYKSTCARCNKVRYHKVLKWNVEQQQTVVSDLLAMQR